MKIGFYVSGKATRVTRLLEFIFANNRFHTFHEKITFVYIDNAYELPIHALCKELNINLIRTDVSATMKQDRAWIVSDELLVNMDKYSTDYLFVFGGQILKGNILDRYNSKIINLHPSLLPAFPGINAIDKALNYGSFLLGNTAHFIDKDIDTGPIIMQNVCIVNIWKGYDTILDKQIPMVLQIVFWLETGRLYIEGRKVRISGARYELGEYIPNLEFSMSITKDKA